MIVRKLIVLVGKGVITVKAIVGSSTLFLSVVLALMVCTGGVGYGADLNIDRTKQYARVGLMTIGGYTATSGASSYCTGDGTCTATYPGNCNLLCEDFEGSTQCYSGYDSVCRRAASGQGYTKWGSVLPGDTGDKGGTNGEFVSGASAFYPYTIYTCPHPLTGLTGVCNASIAGTDGYNWQAQRRMNNINAIGVRFN